MSSISSYLLDLAYSLTNCLSCFPGSPQLKINNRSFKILRLLGEGGFSYVYLVQDKATAQLYALKKIRCPFGQESVSRALKEVEAYSLFAPHANIIHHIDHSISSDKGGDPGAKTVYILLPYYGRGNLQDIINANLVNHTRFPERRLMVLMLGVCKALKAMHQYRVQPGHQGMAKAKRVRREAAVADAEAADEVDEDAEEEEASTTIAANSSRRLKRMKGGGNSSSSRPSASGSHDTESEPLMDDEMTASQQGIEPGQIRAYAHRDIKPGNIMIADDGITPILMDLGSLAPAPTAITSRSLAIAVQDTAAEHSTMPYRAPELFDVKTGSVVDAKVDIWSLGCTIYACLVGKSPFEARSEETGGSLTMCVLGGDWRFPDEGTAAAKAKAKGKEPSPPITTGAGAGGAGGADGRTNGSAADEAASSISDATRDVVRRCLKVEPAERPDVDELIALIDHTISMLPAQGDGDL